MGRTLRLFAVGVGSVLYVWFAAVLHARAVRARKAARRRANGAA